MSGGAALEAVREALDAVRDPEIPALSIADLGVLRDVRLHDGALTVVVTPTYSGCPAMRTIEHDIRAVLAAAGYTAVSVEVRLAPAWSSDWLSPAAHRRLREAGIAPPACASDAPAARLGPRDGVACPQCGSHDTTLLSAFGSTACKALYRCRGCLEPFDYFKCL